MTDVGQAVIKYRLFTLLSEEGLDTSIATGAGLREAAGGAAIEGEEVSVVTLLGSGDDRVSAALLRPGLQVAGL